VNCATQQITIEVERDELFGFLINPANMAKWATGICSGVRQVGDEWLVETMMGDVKLKLVIDKELGVIDYHLLPPVPIQIALYCRVLKNGSGSEFIVSYFQIPLLPNFEKQKQMITKAINKLKEIVESL
jgi:hypothetical protein